MSALFADTFYWIALADYKDDAHERALMLAEVRADDTIITTDEVLAEYLTYFSTGSRLVRSEIAASVRDILMNPVIRVIPQSRASFLEGLDLYTQRSDKRYSLVDCISMQTMWREGLREVLTNDRHFEQEGFRALFRD